MTDRYGGFPTLNGVAWDVFRRTRDEDWRPTRREIEEEYELNEQQVATVKSAAKDIAAEHAAVWGYHKETGTYRFCPENDCTVARQMLNYQITHAAEANGYTEKMVRSAGRRGFITEASAERGRRAALDATTRVRKIYARLVFTE